MLLEERRIVRSIGIFASDVVPPARHQHAGDVAEPGVEQPVELAVRAMQYSSPTGENVLDLFGGSGATLVAAPRDAK